jgi:nucleotide-binding universal stress UspA family protein
MIGMFKHILVPTDFTDKSYRALDIAVELALQHHGKVTLLHVIETLEGMEREELGAFYEKLRARAKKDMRKMIGQYRNQAVIGDRKIVLGKRAGEIVTLARDLEVDLIVLSSHPLDPANPNQDWATISYKVAILAPCPVLMIK